VDLAKEQGPELDEPGPSPQLASMEKVGSNALVDTRNRLHFGGTAVLSKYISDTRFLLVRFACRMKQPILFPLFSHSKATDFPQIEFCFRGIVSTFFCCIINNCSGC
jgi:hypothetical protein